MRAAGGAAGVAAAAIGIAIWGVRGGASDRPSDRPDDAEPAPGSASARDPDVQAAARSRAQTPGRTEESASAPARPPSPGSSAEADALVAEIAGLAGPGTADRLIELLASRSGAVVSAAAAALAARHPEAAERVLAAFREGRLADGHAVAEFLARLGPRGDALLLALLRRTSDDEPELAERDRGLALDALSLRGGAGGPFLGDVAALVAGTPSEDVRGAAVDALLRCGRAGWETVGQVLGSVPAEVRRDVIGRLGVLDDGDLDAAVRVVRAVAEADTDPEVRDSALVFLLDVRSDLRAGTPLAASLDALFVALSSSAASDVAGRWGAHLVVAAAPGTPGRREAIAALLPDLVGGDRVRALTALADEPGLDDAAFAALVGRDLADPATRTFAATSDALRTPRAAAARAEVLAALGSVRDAGRANLLRALALPPHDAPALDALVAALADPDAEVVRAACGTLTAWGPDAAPAYDALLGAAGGRDVRVVSAAVLAAARCGRRDDRLTAALVRASSLAPENGPASARRLAEAWILAALQHEPTRTALLALPRERLTSWSSESGAAFAAAPRTAAAADLAIDLSLAGSGAQPVPMALAVDPVTRARIAERLATSGSPLRAFLVRGLGRTHAAAADVLPIVAAYASDPDPGVRTEVFHVFQSVGRTPDAVAEAALRDLDARDSALRTRAGATLLWNSRVLARAASSFRTWYGDDDPVVDGIGRSALALVREPSLQPALVRDAAMRSGSHALGLWGGPSAPHVVAALDRALPPDRPEIVDRWFDGWWHRARRESGSEFLADAPPRDTVLALLAGARSDRGVGVSASTVVRESLAAPGDGLRAGAGLAAALDPSLVPRAEVRDRLAHAWDGQAVGLILALRRGGPLSADDAAAIAARTANAHTIVREAAR